MQALGSLAGVRGSSRQRPHRFSPTNAALINYGSGTRKQFPSRLAFFPGGCLKTCECFKTGAAVRLIPTAAERMMLAWLVADGLCHRVWAQSGESESGGNVNTTRNRRALAAFRRQQVHREDSGRLYTPTPNPGGPKPSSALGKWG